MEFLGILAVHNRAAVSRSLMPSVRRNFIAVQSCFPNFPAVKKGFAMQGTQRAGLGRLGRENHLEKFVLYLPRGYTCNFFIDFL